MSGSARWFNRSVLAFGLASFLSDLGHEAATAALPGLLIVIGAPPAALGLIEGVADGFATLAKIVGGWLADLPHRHKPIAVAGCFFTGVAKGCYALAPWRPGDLVAPPPARSHRWLDRQRCPRSGP